MDKIKLFIDCYIPTETCNLRCHYCYITQKRKFNAKLATFSHTPQEIRRALSRKRLGGTCLLNMCAGGETLLSDELLPILYELLSEGHYVSVVTNGTLSARFDEIARWPKNLLSHLFFKFSIHFLEMKRLGWMERFFENVRKMKDAGASFTVEVTPSDELIPYIDELKRTCMEYLGALCHVTVARDERTEGIDVLSDHSWEEYKQIWDVFDSSLFRFKTSIFYQKRKEFCYAGAWTYYLNLESGDLMQCYCGETILNIYEDPEASFPEKPIGFSCSLPHCFNGHAWLAFGDIPELAAPTYAEERNRVCEDGSEWLRPEMKAFMNSRLDESNQQYSFLKKKAVQFKQYLVRKGIRSTSVYRFWHQIKGE